MVAAAPDTEQISQKEKCDTYAFVVDSWSKAVAKGADFDQLMKTLPNTATANERYAASELAKYTMRHKGDKPGDAGIAMLNECMATPETGSKLI